MCCVHMNTDFIMINNLLMHFSPRKPQCGSDIGGPLPTQSILSNSCKSCALKKNKLKMILNIRIGNKFNFNKNRNNHAIVVPRASNQSNFSFSCTRRKFALMILIKLHALTGSCVQNVRRPTRTKTKPTEHHEQQCNANIMCQPNIEIYN